MFHFLVSPKLQMRIENKGKGKVDQAWLKQQIVMGVHNNEAILMAPNMSEEELKRANDLADNHKWNSYYFYTSEQEAKLHQAIRNKDLNIRKVNDKEG